MLEVHTNVEDLVIRMIDLWKLIIPKNHNINKTSTYQERSFFFLKEK